MRKTLLVIGSLVVIIGITLTFSFRYMVRRASEEPPPAKTGPVTDIILKKIENFLDYSKWDQTDSIEFQLSESVIEHFRDLKRDLVEVKYPEEHLVVQYFEKSGVYLVQKDDRVMPGETAKQLYIRARKDHDEAYFWLNPFQFLKDGSKKRYVGNRSLLIDLPSSENEEKKLLIVLNRQDEPDYMKLWVPEIPLKGMRVNFATWITTDTGVRLCNVYKTFIREVSFKKTKTFFVRPESKADERFKALLEMR